MTPLRIIFMGTAELSCASLEKLCADVRDVMVNGRPVVRDAKILTLNQDQILQKAAEYGVRVSASLR